VKVEEVQIALRWVPRKSTAVHATGMRQTNWPKNSHTLLRVTSTKTKTQWAMDIGGGQYSICTPFWPWEDYVSRFIDTSQVTEIYYFGTNKHLLSALGCIEGRPSLTYGVVGDAAKAFDEASAAFAKSNKLQLSALLQLGDEEFDARKCALLDAVDMAVREYKVKNAKALAAKYEAVDKYEMKYPGLSAAKNNKITKEFYRQSLATTEHGMRSYMVAGVNHIDFMI
jgi:hypothetical protein